MSKKGSPLAYQQEKMSVHRVFTESSFDVRLVSFRSRVDEVFIPVPNFSIFLSVR